MCLCSNCRPVCGCREDGADRAQINPLLAAPSWICSKTGDAVNAAARPPPPPGPSPWWTCWERQLSDVSVLENKHLYSQFTPHSERERERERELACSILNFSFKMPLPLCRCCLRSFSRSMFSTFLCLFFFSLICPFESVCIPRKTGRFLLHTFTRQRSVLELRGISFRFCRLNYGKQRWLLTLKDCPLDSTSSSSTFYKSSESQA